MENWIEKAIELLERSLYPVPHELNELDWKSDLSNNTDRLAQHISGFSNYSNGGFLIFGINNDATFKSLSKDEMEAIVQRLGNIARNNLAQPIALNHTIIDFKGSPILIIHIPESIEKPVFLRGKDIYYSYTRSAGHTVKLSKTEVKQLIAFSGGLIVESQIALSDLTDDEVLKLIDYDSYFTLSEKRIPDTKAGILDALLSEDLIQKNANHWDILNLGALLFAKDLSQFKTLNRKAARVIVYKDSSRINALKEQVGGRGYASGFQGLVNYIMDQLDANEIIETALRKKVKVFPEKAIREFVANALIHQDLTVSGAGVMIEIFADRMEITNPGVPLVDTNRFIDTAPKSRNESFASLMRRMNICEERGSGIDRAIEAVESFQLPAPKFIRGDDYTRIIVYAPRPLTKMNTEDRIRACYQHTCLHYVNNQVVNNQSIRLRFNIGKNNVSFASKIINDTVEAGLIKASDPESASRKFASYIPFWA